MIPKVIHYCWFGRSELPPLAKKCIASWRKFLPDYEIKEWNEDNYDITKNTYMASAYKEKKFGFVPDYIRSDLIYKYGGFYFDTDVEVIKPLDSLLQYRGIMGFESKDLVAGGLIVAGEKGLEIFKEMRDIYNNISFYNKDGSLNLQPSPAYNTEVLVKHGLQRNGMLQEVAGITIFPTDYFCPKPSQFGKVRITENTLTIHHYAASWVGTKQKFANFLIRIFGKRLILFLWNTWNCFTKHNRNN